MAVFEGLSEKLQNIVGKMRGKSRVSETDLKLMMREIRLALLEADVNIKVVKELTREISEKSKGSAVMESLTPGQQVVKIVHESLIDILSIGNSKLEVSPSGFTVIMLLGLQGSGKTTTAAKLGKFLKESGKKPMLCSVDTHRPAAARQLEILAKSSGLQVYIEPEEKDAVQLAKKAVARAKYMLCDTLIVDTAGRMTVDEELMKELREISAEVNPTEKLLVVDSMIGQEAVETARHFDSDVGLSGFVMTKLDGDSRGGAALSIAYVLQKPIKFIGVGEKINQFEIYHPDRMASRILGMGDVLSLIEEASKNLDEKKAMDALEKMKQNRFTLQDMLGQFEEMEKMGPLKDILSKFPGMNKNMMDKINPDDNFLSKNKAIIRSMTMKERLNPAVLNASRRKRIAAGSGTSVQDVNKLIKQYDDSLKLFKRFGGGKRKGLGKLLSRGGGFPF